MLLCKHICFIKVISNFQNIFFSPFALKFSSFISDEAYKMVFTFSYFLLLLFTYKIAALKLYPLFSLCITLLRPYIHETAYSNSTVICVFFNCNIFIHPLWMHILRILLCYYSHTIGMVYVYIKMTFPNDQTNILTAKPCFTAIFLFSY